MATRTRRRDSSGHVDPFARRRRRFEAALRPVGLWDAFAALPRPYRELFWKLKFPDPAVAFDASVPDDPDTAVLRRELEAGIFAATISIDGTDVAVRDFIGVIAGLRATVEAAQLDPKLDDVAKPFVAAAAPVLAAAWEAHVAAAARAIYDAIHAPLYAHSRSDGRLLMSRTRYDKNAAGKSETRVVVSARPGEGRPVTVDAAPRRAWRVPSLGGGEVGWVAWRGGGPTPAAGGAAGGGGGAGTDGGAGGDDGVPLYAQSHALRQLRARVNSAGLAPYAEAWLAASLDEPVVVERRPGGDLLVEYRIKDLRLGYLVVTPLADCAVVRTFLFLTMQGTPEARLLARRLRLGRRTSIGSGSRSWPRSPRPTCGTTTSCGRCWPSAGAGTCSTSRGGTTAPPSPSRWRRRCGGIWGWRRKAGVEGGAYRPMFGPRAWRLAFAAPQPTRNPMAWAVPPTFQTHPAAVDRFTLTAGPLP